MKSEPTIVPIFILTTQHLLSQETMSLGFQTRYYTNLAVQPQKMARGLEFRILKVEGLYY